MTLGLSGGNRYIFELSNALVDRGHKVTITHAGLPKQHKWFEPKKAKIIECGYSPFERVLIKAKLKKYNQDERLQRLTDNIPDCDVNVATYCLTAEPTVNSKKGSMFYLVQHYEPLFFPEQSKNYLSAEESYNLPLKKLCVSKWLVDKVGGVCIGNGIDLGKFKRSEKPKISNSVMLMVRENLGWKHPNLTLKVADILRSLDYPVFIADGSLSDEQLVDMYQKSVVFVYLSEQESFGMPLAEAMACGCTIVSTPCSFFLKEMFNAYILKSLSLPSVATAIGEVLSNSVLRSILISNGFETAKNFSFEKVVDKFEQRIGAT